MAASGTSVTVLTPNGRRQTVKVSLNTPLLQVLEDVCKKHGFHPDDHGLKFQRTTVDLTRPWRFANLPNNAKLEMVPSTRKQAGADVQVRIALQMEDGSRLQGSFSCGQTLWELITHFPQISTLDLSESGSIPVCVYMRDEVSGEDALKKATLKSLGLTAGSAIVRFLLKNKDGGEATVTMPTTPAASETPTSQPSQPDLTTTHAEKLTNEAAVENSSRHEPIETHATFPVEKEVVPNAGGPVQPECCPGRKGPAEEDDEKPGPSGLNSHPAPSAPFIPFSGGGQRLGGPGGGAAGRTPPSSSSSSSLTATVESPKAKKAKSSHSCSAKRPPTEEPEEEEEEEEEPQEPMQRELLIYHRDSASRHPEGGEHLPDAFFEVTVDDVRKRFAQLKSERKLFEEAPLMTTALREAQKKEKMERYPKVVLRVQFPDRHVLQGFFRPLETVGAVMHFVRRNLEDSELRFYLFITPPKTILDDPSVTLFQADLFPGALLYFGSDVRPECYIKRERLESSSSALQANQSIARICPLSAAASEELPPLEPTEDASESTQDARDPSDGSRAPKPTRSDPGKVPKWLKLPGKDGKK
ncbi:tether containing UBX domain for GLUT4 isoform X2 [Brachionichthys hirsutus]|uniref:tether containing UBX domain for GLUT4 isoform X2 n=1 Tax=Brachionichthys hirsutus TaxID=412623 RepID=UPI0036048780